jgi:glucose 1-dehydrogenase
MRAVVTGAAGGIGRGVAQALSAGAAARGDDCRLLLVDRDGPRVADLAAQLAGAEALALDLADPAAGETVAGAARERLGGLDALISNAGVVEACALADLELSDWDRTFAINTRATFLLARAAYPLLREAGGAIVATASIAAREPAPPMGAYGPSKAALVMLVRQLAYEWGPDGIRCNCVSPGTTHTGMTDGTYSDPEAKAERASHLPLRRIADPEEIAAVIAFLAGPEAGYVTGIDVLVDGGLGTSLLAAVRGLTPA